MKPTPEEKYCKCLTLHGGHAWNCPKYVHSPSPEARVGCMCGSGYASDCKVHNPTEARVDWEKEAFEIVDDNVIFLSKEALRFHIAKALSAAFEKGREAR